MIFTFCTLSFSFLTLLFDAVFKYRNEAYFNGQCFHICQGKVYVKRTSNNVLICENVDTLIKRNSKIICSYMLRAGTFRVRQKMFKFTLRGRFRAYN